MATVVSFRDLQTAQRYRNNPHLYARLVKALATDAKAGREALHEAYTAMRREPPKESA